MHLTVLVCTHDRWGSWNGRSSFSTRHAGPDCNVDVLVVANACTDRTHEFLEDRRGRHGLPLRWTRSRRQESRTRSTGDGKLDSDWVAFVDDDHRVDSAYLHALRAVRTNPDTDIFCGRILPDWTAPSPPGPRRGRVPDLSAAGARYDLGDATLDAPNTGVPGGGNLVLRPRLFALAGPSRSSWGRRSQLSAARIRIGPPGDRGRGTPALRADHRPAPLRRSRAPTAALPAAQGVRALASVVRMGADGTARVSSAYMIRKWRNTCSRS